MKGTTLTINKVLCQEPAHPVGTSKKQKKLSAMVACLYGVCVGVHALFPHMQCRLYFTGKVVKVLKVINTHKLQGK